MTITITLNPDGPHSPDYTVAVADAFAESVRVLNYATFGHRDAGLQYVADVYAVLGRLSSGCAGMPQLAEQLSGYLHDQLDRAELGLDDGGDPQTAITTAALRLKEASYLAAQLTEALATAQNAISAVHHREGS